MKNKYNAKKVTVDGIVFDSAKEAERYKELLSLEKAGAIQDLQLQPWFELIPAQYETFERYGKTGKRLKDGRRCVELSLSYKGDFAYTENGKRVVEDVKGYRNPASSGYAKYIIKRKLMLYVHGIRIKEV